LRKNVAPETVDHRSCPTLVASPGRKDAAGASRRFGSAAADTPSAERSSGTPRSRRSTGDVDGTAASLAGGGTV
jgi:hypothetical protein